jgi:3-dehydroquinate synthetase
MIRSSLARAMIEDVAAHFALVPDLLSLTVHGSYAACVEDRHYVDIDLIFLFDDRAISSGILRIETYFSQLVRQCDDAQHRILYRIQSGPMHPLRSPGELSAPHSLGEQPVIFFHISVFPRSFYSTTQPRGHRPSLLLLYSWQSAPPLLGHPLSDFAIVERLSIEDIRFEGLGVKDSLSMLRNRIKFFWDCKMGPGGAADMVWKSSQFEDMEVFELPLYIFKWCATNCARLIRDQLPVSQTLSDMDVFFRFVLAPGLTEVGTRLRADLDRIDCLRVDFAEAPSTFWRSLSEERLYADAIAVLKRADSRLEQISLVRERGYDFAVRGKMVPITLTMDLAATLAKTIGELKPDRIMAVADSELEQLYDPLQLTRACVPDATLVRIGGSGKTLEMLASLLKQAEDQGLTASSALLAFGGGTAGNTTGTAAGLICRGSGLIHVPTTLVAQLDSAIGAKQSVNGALGKNYLGLFYEPTAVILQPLFLLSLRPDQVLDGLVEAVKHGLCQDDRLVGAVLEYVRQTPDPSFERLVSILTQTIELKLQYLKVDPLENNPETHLELGHKVGHAVEFLSNSHISHGQSVAFGMIVEAALFASLGRSDEGTFEYVRNAVVPLIAMPYAFERFQPISIAEQLWHDNKRSGDSVPFSYLAAPQYPKSCRCRIDEPFLACIAAALHKTKEVLGCRPQ